MKNQKRAIPAYAEGDGLRLVADQAKSGAHVNAGTGLRKTRVHELDGLRAIAILLVIGCHYHWFAARLWGLPKFGWVGVDVFFVLSGYLITSILLGLKGDEHPFRRFYKRRCLRILPPLLLSLLAIALACALVRDHNLFSRRSLANMALFAQSFGSPRFLLHPHWQPLTASRLPTAPLGLLGPMSNSASILWSLSIEEYFYLLWAPAVLLLSRKSILRVAFAICAGEVVFRWLYFRGRQDYFSIYHRFDALIYGALAALLFQQFLRRRWIPRLLAVLSAGLVIAILWRSAPVVGFELRSDPTFMILGLPLVSIFVGSIVCLIVMEPGSRHPAWVILRSWPMRTVGVVSYTLYLIHGLVYLLLSRVIQSPAVCALSSLGIAVFAAWLSWHFVESPILAMGEVPAGKLSKGVPVNTPLQPATPYSTNMQSP
jgi:peptidoglycan/LPS O-acetylase OafA/YrhL